MTKTPASQLAANKAYREANKERIQARKAARYAENKEKIRIEKKLLAEKRATEGYFVHPSGEKECCRCKNVLPVSMFGAQRAAKDGLNYACKSCIALQTTERKDKTSATSKAWYAANRERRLAAGRAWVDANRDRRSEAMRRYRQENRDRVNAAIKAWSEKNRDRKSAQVKIWSQKNRDRCLAKVKRHRQKYPERMRAQAAKYFASQVSATPKWANMCEIRKFYALSAKLTAETGIPHHVDHIVPIRSKIVCGLHWEANLQVIPGVENCRKGNRHWPDMP